MTNVYEELAESSRRALLLALRMGPRSVSELVEETGFKQPNVSNHLSRLREKGLVTACKVGRQVFYSLASLSIQEAVAVVNSTAPRTCELGELSALAHAYAKAAVAGDEVSCQQMVDHVIRGNVPLLEIYEGLLGAAMNHVGTWYGVKAIDEAQEHMASEVTERMMARVMHATSPLSKEGKTAVIGCAANSWHVIGLRMVSDYLRYSGWQTQFLGANVPTEAFVASVRASEPELILVNCNAEDSRDETLALLRELKASRPRKGSMIGVGGSEVAKDPKTFLGAGADFWSASLREFAEQILPSLEPSRAVKVSA